MIASSVWVKKNKAESTALGLKLQVYELLNYSSEIGT